MKILNRLISLMLAISLVLGTGSIAFGQVQNNVQLKLNDEIVDFENGVYINDQGIIMIPIRQLAEALEYEIKWDGTNYTVSLVDEFNTIEMKIEENIINVNGDPIALKSDLILKYSKTYVPMEVLNYMDHLVQGWYEKEGIISIREVEENKEEYFKQSTSEVIREMKEYLSVVEKQKNFNGSVLVAKDGEILLSEGYGYSNLEQSIENNLDTRFAIGSITKQFIAMAIAQLYEKDLLDLEDPLDQYIPEAPHGNKINIHQLLTHSSGLVNYTEVVEILTSHENAPMAIIDRIEDEQLEFNPGETFRYSNTNYLLLGMIVEEITGISYEEYLEENIFKPLNMKDTGVTYGKNYTIHDATAYIGHLELEEIDDGILLKKAHGAGSMYSTVEDLYRWDRALYTETLVNKETMDKIFSPHIKAESLGASYGYGWIVGDTAIGRFTSHGGNTLGFTANMDRFIDEDLVLIILSNKGHSDVSSISNTLLSIVYGIEYAMPRSVEEIELEDKSIYADYVGVYELYEGVYMNVTTKDGHLYAQLTGQGAFEIHPSSESDFFYKIVDAHLSFFRNESGNVERLILFQSGQEMQALKIR